MKLTTTLNRLRSAAACKERYAHLLHALGGATWDHDAPIDLLEILRHNGIDDCLWALCATEQNCERVARLMATEFAKAVLAIYKEVYGDDLRRVEAFRDLFETSGEAVEDASATAARASAWAACVAAAAGGPGWNDAREAAWQGAWSAVRENQERIIRSYLQDEIPEMRAKSG